MNPFRSTFFRLLGCTTVLIGLPPLLSWFLLPGLWRYVGFVVAVPLLLFAVFYLALFVSMNKNRGTQYYIAPQALPMQQRQRVRKKKRK